MVGLESKRVVLLGTGRIADSVAEAMSCAGIQFTTVDLALRESNSPFPKSYGLAILVEDEWTGVTHPSMPWLREQEIPLLVVSGRMSKILVGPLELPNVPGCSTCVNQRWMNSLRLSPLLASLGTSLEQRGSQVHLPLTVKDKDLRAFTDFLIDALLNIMTGRTTSILGKVGVMRAGSSSVEVKTLAPSDDCQRCGEMVTCTDIPSGIGCRSYQVSLPDQLRVKDIKLSELRSVYVNSDIGLVSDLVRQEIGCHIGVNARIQLTNQRIISGFGIANTVEEAEKTAILEVLERTCGRYPSHRTQSTVGSYYDLSDIALDPSVFGLHDTGVYDRPAGRYHRFCPTESYHWVEGLSCVTKRQVLIPEQIAYHRVRRQGEPKFVQQTSNGCAIGSSYEEAVLYGLFELMERDAFLTTWYGKLPAPELPLKLTPNVRPWIENLWKNGYDVRLFDISHDFEIPSVLAIAVNRRNEFPNVVCGTSTHLLCNVAVYKAVRELFAQVFNLQSISSNTIRLTSEKLHDPSMIQTIADHRLVGALPEARSHWSFLLDGRTQSDNGWDKFAQVREKFDLRSNDINIILNRALEDMFRHGFDVIVVPQTRLELTVTGLNAVRVLVPGMLPMTFGHDYRRIQGLDRVFELPQKLGYSSRPLEIQDLNSNPHPFG